MRVSKSRLIFASLMIFMIIGSVYSQDAARQEKAQATKKAPQGTQQISKESGYRPLTPTATQKEAVTPTPTPGHQAPLKFFVFTEECFNKLTSGIIDIDCIKFSISKLLSYGIIGGSLLYKAPQIIKILGSGSVEGLSLSGFYFQLISVLITIGYNIHLKAPITTYAENISVMVQTAIIIVLYWKFKNSSRICVLASTGLFAAIGGIMYLDILPEIIYKGIGIINIVLFILAVYPQIKLNYQNKSTGQLALLTVLLAWAGNVARVFTTLQEVNDKLLLAFFVIGSLLNGTVLMQFVIYRGKAPKVSDKKE